MNAIKEEAEKLEQYVKREDAKKFQQLFIPLQLMYKRLNANFSLLHDKDKIKKRLLK